MQEYSFAMPRVDVVDHGGPVAVDDGQFYRKEDVNEVLMVAGMLVKTMEGYLNSQVGSASVAPVKQAISRYKTLI